MRSNWLPCPTSGLFRLNYRIYLPAETARTPATLSKYPPHSRRSHERNIGPKTKLNRISLGITRVGSAGRLFPPLGDDKA